MTDNEKALAAKLLRIASNDFANHGCNDFMVQTTAENCAIFRKTWRDAGQDPNDFDEQPEECDEICIDDYILMDYLADKLESEISRVEITMFPVDSSNLEAIGYHGSARELRVRFKGGKCYSYADVSPELHMAFMQSKSKGGFFHNTIRGKFETSTVEA